jgi:hypothetical protein
MEGHSINFRKLDQQISMKACLTFMLLFLALNQSPGQEFTSSTKSGVDLKVFETFTVVKGVLIVKDNRAIDKDEFFTEILKSIRHEMESRGYIYQEDSTAQLFVSYVVETTLASESENLGPMGLTPTANAAMVDQSRTWSRSFRQGILILEIEDQRNNVLWSSEGVMDISRSRGGNVLDFAVQAAFRKFPDKTKKEKIKKSKKG